MEDINIRIAQQVREIRLARGYTLDILASRCQVSRSAISLIERGEASPTAVVLEKLANGLGVPLTQLFDSPRILNRLNLWYGVLNKQNGKIQKRDIFAVKFASKLEISISNR